MIPLVNTPTMQGLYRVLYYLKFLLSESGREEVLGDYLPFAELVAMPARLAALPPCRDPDDQKFIELAFAAEADMPVTGDQDLLVLADQMKFGIYDPAAFRETFAGINKR